MKIKSVKINSYGNLQNKDIEFCDGINIIYGKNESGKSTLLKFIINMFYGTSKNKKGRDLSDFDKYKPWNKEEFSGRIEYELDNGEKYEVFREFGKKNPKIFNANLEEISKQFNIDKNTGNQFFYDQTKIDEETFMSTFVSMQQEVKLDTQSQNVLIQKIANLAGTGDDSVSYKKAIEKLAKRQLDEIGTNRSQGKPINIITNKINTLNNEKSQLENYKEYKYEIEQNKNGIEDSIEQKEIIHNILKEIKMINDKEENEFLKIELNKKSIANNIEQNKTNFEKIFELKKQLINPDEEEFKEYSLEDFKKYGSKIFDEEDNKTKKIEIDKDKINKKVNKLVYLIIFLVEIGLFGISVGVIHNLYTAIFSVFADRKSTRLNSSH